MKRGLNAASERRAEKQAKAGIVIKPVRRAAPELRHAGVCDSFWDKILRLVARSLVDGRNSPRARPVAAWSGADAITLKRSSCLKIGKVLRLCNNVKTLKCCASHRPRAPIIDCGFVLGPLLEPVNGFPAETLTARAARPARQRSFTASVSRAGSPDVQPTFAAAFGRRAIDPLLYFLPIF